MISSSLRRLFAAATLACLVTGPVLAQDYKTMIDLPKGAVIDLVIESSRVQTTGGETSGEGMTLISRFKQEITPTDDGYRVVQSTVSQEARTREGDREAVTPMTEIRTPDLTFDADASLAPVAIVDWNKSLDEMMATLTKTLGAEADSEQGKMALQFVRSTFGRMSPQQAAESLLQEQMMVSVPQNLELDLDDPISGEVELESPIGGGVKGSATIELVQLDKASGRAVILMKEALDPASASALARRAINQMVEALPSGTPRPTDAELAALKLERSTSCRYEMDLKTGLALKTDCTTTIVAMDASLQANKRVDRRIITQALALP